MQGSDVGFGSRIRGFGRGCSIEFQSNVGFKVSGNYPITENQMERT